MDGKFRNNSLNDLVKYSLIKTQFGAIRPPKVSLALFHWSTTNIWQIYLNKVQQQGAII